VRQPRRGNRGKKRDDVGLAFAAGFLQHTADVRANCILRDPRIGGDGLDGFSGGETAGDARGELVDEKTIPAPSSERSLARLTVEKSWAAIGKESDKKVYILRLAGIYGPGRNVLLNLKTGTAKRVVKRGQVFNRIHV
jgi:hypothetical protein